MRPDWLPEGVQLDFASRKCADWLGTVDQGRNWSLHHPFLHWNPRRVVCTLPGVVHGMV